ncbi:MAG: DUF58 domain-containing protein, partial [Algiphilus sp.]
MGSLRPVQRFRRAFENWLLRRVPPQSLPQRVGRRRVYIMPTPAGYAFGALVFALWLGSMNYANSMGFALAFLLAGVGLVAMHLTHANLLGIHLRQCHAKPVHAGQVARVALVLRHDGARPRPAIFAHWPQSVAAGSDGSDLPASDPAHLHLVLPTSRRGWLPLPPIALETTFPLGLFRAWTWIRPDIRVLVYPAADTRGPSFPQAHHAEGEDSGRSAGREHFDSLRDYRHGDPMHDIHWKRLAKDSKPTVKQFLDTADHRLWIDWQAL